MTQEQLNEILRLHKLWFGGKEGGVRADLTGANLISANLTGANLISANLTGANLTRANLTHAELFDANLTGADLTGADLTSANLTGVNLTGANLDYASWPLWCGSLRVKGDEALCAQLMYHIARLMQNSGMTVGEEIRKLANKAPQIERYGLPKIGE